MQGTNIAGVQFRRAGRIYDFAMGDIDISVGDDVVVETDRGPSLAKVAVIKFIFPSQTSASPKDLKSILRIASRRDLDDAKKLTPESATEFARSRVERLGLKMTVLQSEVQFGGNKVIVYFTAPGRVDFRELVKELASGLKARVELKQVGARDEAKLVGGLGICGREFCCSSFLREFVPVSIKMAKNQNLALNPTKVSGGCGRLLCCLTYENDLYTDLRANLPERGTRVRTKESYTSPEGISGQLTVGIVTKVDVLNQFITIETEDHRQTIVPVGEFDIIEPAQRTAPDEEDDEWGQDLDLDALSRLEDGSQQRPRGPKPNRNN